MKNLKFYDRYIEPIKEGVKTSTIREHFDGKVYVSFSDSINFETCLIIIFPF